MQQRRSGGGVSVGVGGGVGVGVGVVGAGSRAARPYVRAAPRWAAHPHVHHIHAQVSAAWPPATGNIGSGSLTIGRIFKSIQHPGSNECGYKYCKK